MSSRIPHLLEPYLALPPEASLILLTNVLGASSNWLVLRFLHNAVNNSDVSAEKDEPQVVLVSFMRDLAFWKDNGKRLGIDIERLAAENRFAFIDGLSGLFASKQRTASFKIGDQILSSPELSNISDQIRKQVNKLKAINTNSKILLVVDQLDLLLAAGGEQVGPINVAEMLQSWREDIHAAVVTLSVDDPLVSAQQTPLETNHAAFLLSIAHQADLVMNLRLLDTGTARDVSGVLQISRGDALEDQGLENSVEDKELLYYVAGDGGVRVFERGQ